jgi:hypothetical protein
MQGEYEKWEYYRRTCSTLESDQEYVKFWETLLSTTQLIGWYITRTTCESRIERLFYYHTLKIAAVHPNVYKTLIRSGCIVRPFHHMSMWLALQIVTALYNVSLCSGISAQLAG